MLEDPRPHAVRARGRQLCHIESMPHTPWRLHDLSKGLRRAGRRFVTVCARMGSLSA
jgi:hypothetical protein